MATSLIRRPRVGALNPWRMMEEMENRMWDWMNTPTGFTPVSRLFGEAHSYVPPVDIYETRDDVLVAASLPGINVGSIQLEVKEGYVSLSGEQQPTFAPEQATEVTAHLAGIPRYGRFSFRFALPCEVEHERAEAVYRDGVLRVRFPKAQAARPVSIPIRLEGMSPAIENADNPRHDQRAQIEAEAPKGRKK